MYNITIAWKTGIASHKKTLALFGKRQIDGEQLGNPRYTAVNWTIDREGEVMRAWEFRASDVPPSIELLRGLKPREIDLIIAAGRPRRFAANSVMTYQGETAKHLLLLWKGRARYFYETSNDKKLILRWIIPGHIFGGAALASGPSCGSAKTACDENFGPCNIVTVSTKLVVRVQSGRAATAASKSPGWIRKAGARLSLIKGNIADIDFEDKPLSKMV